ncbi:Signal transduction histidine kinase [Rhizobium sp. NFR07]|uniref:sensor histidine kinase n=1 Tax=Rhizobium sp. NFR07 TaxID=1566262 RepID=UPI0008E1C2F1|nr:ATP-binding protein [Rhizobium sp. NFR07]SFB53179.1 Signal transduction histidine kinase [Rhizobium sp. NFR07]
MPFSNAKFARSSLMMLLIGAALLLGIVLSSFFLAQMTRTYFDEVTKLRAVRSVSADLLLMLNGAESGQRGYLLVQNEAFLDPYQKAIEALPAQVERLARVAENQDTVAVPLDEIRQLIAEKVTEMQSTLNLASQGRVADAVDIVRNESGFVVMQRLREVIGSLLQELDGHLISGIDEIRGSAATLQYFTIGGGLLIIIVIGGAIAVVAQHVRELSSARREVEELNEGLEERVNERTEDLMQANREIQRYAYIVSHDLRAPLVNIMGFTSELDATLKTIRTYVMADGTEMTEDQVRDARLAVEEDLPEAIGFIRSSTKKMDALINAILKISRDGRRELKPERIDLGEMLEATAASVYHQVNDAGGEVSISVGAARGLVTDRFSLEQIFGNLFDNAVKYRDPNRPLNLSVKALPMGRGAIKIEVADNGRGIAPEDHERVFELFRRSGVQNQKGEGIGLAHVRSLVRNLGGEITVTSTLGGGSTFIVRLPMDLSQYVRSNGS